MDANIEDLVLSGKLFNGDSRSSSPARSDSSSVPGDLEWDDDNEKDDDSLRERSRQIDSMLGGANGAYQESIGMGPGRTGVKGVIRDRHEAATLHAQRRAREIQDLNQRMLRTSVSAGGKTFLEEERERQWMKQLMEGETGEDEKRNVRRDVLGRQKDGRFGHLREVGIKGFVAAVEREDRGIWVVVHLYHPSLDRCQAVDETLGRLARTYPNTKFLRARASALGFASTTPSSRRSTYETPSRSIRNTQIYKDGDEEDDPYADENEKGTEFDDVDDEDYDYDHGPEEHEVDTDMLPTLLVYRDGELVHNWVRVDWEAGKAGIGELLVSCHVLGGPILKSDNCGLPSDDDDDLIWSDEEDISGS